MRRDRFVILTVAQQPLKACRFRKASKFRGPERPRRRRLCLHGGNAICTRRNVSEGLDKRTTRQEEPSQVQTRLREMDLKAQRTQPCRNRKLSAGRKKTKHKAKRRLRKPANSSARKWNTFAKASTAPARRSRQSPSDFPRHGEPA